MSLESFLKCAHLLGKTRELHSQHLNDQPCTNHVSLIEDFFVLIVKGISEINAWGDEQ